MIVSIEGDGQSRLSYRGFTRKNGNCCLEAGASGLIVIQPAFREVLPGAGPGDVHAACGIKIDGLGRMT